MKKTNLFLIIIDLFFAGFSVFFIISDMLDNFFEVIIFLILFLIHSIYSYYNGMESAN